jgi:hypothetical protein
MWSQAQLFSLHRKLAATGEATSNGETEGHSMTKKAKRRFKKGDATFVSLGHLLERDPNYGLPVVCYVCETPHKALGLARIRDKHGATHVPLCEPCLKAARNGPGEQAILRKYWNAPDLEMSDGGGSTTELVTAIAEKQDKTEH